MGLYPSKPSFSISHNTFRNLLIITMRKSSYDRKYFHHEDWMFPIFDVTEEQVVYHIETYCKLYPKGTIKLVDIPQRELKHFKEFIIKKFNTINIL